MLAQELNALLRENISSRGPAQALFEVGPSPCVRNVGSVCMRMWHRLALEAFLRNIHHLTQSSFIVLCMGCRSAW
jgi:hypothetical protein